MTVSSVRVWILVMEEMMTYTMCMTRPGGERVAQQTLSTGQVRMSTETCTEMIWRSWFKPTGELTRDRYCTCLVGEKKYVKHLLHTDYQRKLTGVIVGLRCGNGFKNGKKQNRSIPPEDMAKYVLKIISRHHHQRIVKSTVVA